MNDFLDRDERRLRSILSTVQPQIDQKQVRRNMLQAIKERQSRRANDWPYFTFAWQYGVPIVILAVCLAVFLTHERMPRTPIGTVDGAISYFDQNTRNWRALESHTVCRNDQLQTHHTPCTIRLDDGSVLTLAPQTGILIGEHHGMSLYISQGRIDAEIEPQPEGRPFQVHTPTMQIEVVGTRFSVTVE